MAVIPVCDAAVAGIRRKCLDCCGGSAKLVDECNVYTCPLYEWRDGKPKRIRPEAGQITLDEWQKERRYGGTIPV